MAIKPKNLLDSETLAEKRKSLTTEVIGISEEGRPLTLTFIGNKSPSSSLRILVIAGQHGDERYARRACVRLVNYYIENQTDPLFEEATIAILDDANPDGSCTKSRLNKLGIDLNRDHQLLSSKETQSIHNFARRWDPHVVLDIHNYPSKRRHLLDQNMVLNTDVFVDTTTNPAASCRSNSVSTNWDQDLMIFIQSDLRNHGLSCERYTLIKPSGKTRHSTLDIVDARNMLSLRYNSLGILVEGRNPTVLDGKEERSGLLDALRLAMLSCIKWSVNNKRGLEKMKEYVASPEDKFPIRAKYSRAEKSFNFNFKNQRTGNEEVVAIQDYRSDLKITRVIDLPVAYAVPADMKSLIEVLTRHGFSSIGSGASYPASRSVEYYVVKNIRNPGTSPRRNLKLSLIKEQGERSLNNYIIYPVKQKGGHCLPLFLEPKSKYSLHRYDVLGIPIQEGKEYPLIRVCDKCIRNEG